jgi:hypothetical protein
MRGWLTARKALLSCIARVVPAKHSFSKAFENKQKHAQNLQNVEQTIDFLKKKDQRSN